MTSILSSWDFCRCEFVTSVVWVSSWYLSSFWVRNIYCHCDFAMSIIIVSSWNLLALWVRDTYLRFGFVISIGIVSPWHPSSLWVRGIYRSCEFVRSIVILTLIVMVSSWHLLLLFSSRSLSSLWVCEICMWVRDMYRHCEFVSSWYLPSLWVRGIYLLLVYALRATHTHTSTYQPLRQPFVARTRIFLYFGEGGKGGVPLTNLLPCLYTCTCT